MEDPAKFASGVILPDVSIVNQPAMKFPSSQKLQFNFFVAVGLNPAGKAPIEPEPNILSSPLS